MSSPILSSAFLAQHQDTLPDYPRLEALPEKMLQFGTGVLLRGLVDYFVDKANRQGIFNGRVVMVKSTGYGDIQPFVRQDCLYTHWIRGIENGNEINERLINAAISRVLTVQNDWIEIVNCAKNPGIKVVVSNSTEVGIQLVEEDIINSTPTSFPAKLAALLYQRYLALGNVPGSGWVIVPTELVPNNGRLLRDIVIAHASRHLLGDDFIYWVEKENRFCDSLVDRIVPGSPNRVVKKDLQKDLPYKDELSIVSEAYRLWAIEGDKEVKLALSFAMADKGVVIRPNIDIYRELKLRLLNGTHTFSVAGSFLSGYDVVSKAMADEHIERFIRELMLNEIALTLPDQVSEEEADTFGAQVIDRFKNPFIEHKLLNITLHFTAKMRMRNVPTILNYFERYDEVPLRMAKGFAAYLFFMRPVEKNGTDFLGIRNRKPYPIRCEEAGYFYSRWNKHSTNFDALVKEVLGNEHLWGTNLEKLSGFAEAVSLTMKEAYSKGLNKLIS